MQKDGVANTGRTGLDSFISSIKRYESIFIIALLSVVLSVITYEMKLLNSQLVINRIAGSNIDYEEFRKLLISEKSVNRINKEVNQILKRKPEYKGILYMDPVGYLTFSMMAGNYDLINNSPVDKTTFIRGLGRLSGTGSFRELYIYYKAIFSDVLYFPVARMHEADISYSDSWFSKRTYGGLRNHEGCDIMADNNLPGYFPVVSMTDGVVEKLGWLEQGGYRIGVRSGSGGYFYYAHLYKYAENIDIGDKIEAGQLLGFMGDSGYGPEGTTGKFDVHLHLGIYVNSDAAASGEMSVNPYHLLKMLEKNRVYIED